MKIKNFKDSYSGEPKKQDKKKRIKADKKWLLIVTVLSFVISLCMSLVSELIIPNAVIAISVFLVLMFIFIGVIFDIIGLSVATADEKIFHSMATKKVKGAKEAIKLINNKDKFSSFFNDVIGDVCGIVSGTSGVVIVSLIIKLTDVNELLVSLIVTGLISSLTIGGKAFGKSIAINNCNEILFEFSKFLSIFSKK